MCCPNPNPNPNPNCLQVPGYKGELGAFFCSELVAAALEEVGVLASTAVASTEEDLGSSSQPPREPPSTPSPVRQCNSYLPDDFSTTGEARRRVRLAPGHHFGQHWVLDLSAEYASGAAARAQ